MLSAESISKLHPGRGEDRREGERDKQVWNAEENATQLIQDYIGWYYLIYNTTHSFSDDMIYQYKVHLESDRKVYL